MPNAFFVDGPLIGDITKVKEIHNILEISEPDRKGNMRITAFYIADTIDTDRKFVIYRLTTPCELKRAVVEMN